MSLQYAHSLIPVVSNFTPNPQQTANFITRLSEIGAAPLQAALRVGKLTGGVRTGTDPLTGAKISIPRRSYSVIESGADLPSHLMGLDEYDLGAEGQGPPAVRPFRLYSGWDGFGANQRPEQEFTGSYAFEVWCNLRSRPVSTSSWGNSKGKIQKLDGIPNFGEPCVPGGRAGFFENPWTGQMIEVPDAGCARFWIEFRFGKWLAPRIADHLNLLEPSIVACAESEFQSPFAQGCLVL